MAKIVNNYIMENISDKLVLNKKYEKFLLYDLFFFITMIKQKYPLEYQNQMFESVYDMVSLVPEEYIKNSNSYYQTVFRVVLNRNWDDLRLLADYSYKRNPKLPSNLASKYGDWIDFNKDSYGEELRSSILSVVVQNENLVLEFSNYVPFNFKDNFDDEFFELINDGYNYQFNNISDNKLYIPLDSIHYGNNVLIASYSFDNIVKTENVKINFTKSFDFNDCRIIIRRDKFSNVNIVKMEKGNGELLIDNVELKNNMIQFHGKINGCVENIIINDLFDFGKLEYEINKLSDGKFNFSIEFTDFLKTPLKKWFLFLKEPFKSIKLNKDYDLSHGNYTVQIRNNEWCMGVEVIKNEFKISENITSIQNNQPKISVILPVYNVSNYIGRAFNSLLNQSIGFENLEVIFVDDSSTDNSPNIIKEYCEKYFNVKGFFLDYNSGGAGGPRNVGIKNSTADYLMFLDPDDLLFDDACEFLYDEIIKENIDIVSGVHTRDGVNPFMNVWDKTLSVFGEKFDVNSVGDDFSLKLDSVSDCETAIANYGLSSKIFKKEFIVKNNIDFPDKLPAEDSVFLFNALLNADGIKFFNKVIYYYTDERKSGDNLSLSYIRTKNSLINRLDSYYKMYFLSMDNGKSDIFKRHLLVDKLNYFVNSYLLECDLKISDLLDVLMYAMPLFKLCVDTNLKLNLKFWPLFEYIACNDYENALKFIFNNNIPFQKDIKVAAILDQFSYDSFSPEFKLIDLYPDSWKDTFEKEKPDLFFCESTYHGIKTDNESDGVWKGKIYSQPNNQNSNSIVKEIVSYCRDNNIVSIFWNKEDPVAWDDVDFDFIDAALEFDYIFTSCEESIRNYNDKGHDNVSSLMFAVQPKLFNPINAAVRLKDTIVFAGSWYAKFHQRCSTMELMFDEILNNNLKLKIYDRFHNKNFKDMTFPDKYSDYIHPAVDYSEMPNVYKESVFGLNFNTVTDSNTMFARRVFELMASNTIVLSNYSKGVYKLFKDNVFYLDKNGLDFNQDFDLLRKENLNNVLENHNYENRFRKILDTINFKYVPYLKHIVIFYELNDLKDLIKINNHFHSIKYSYKHLKYVVEGGAELAFLNDSVLKDDLKNIDLENNYYFCFTDYNSNTEFIKNALLHFSYIDNDVGIKENDDDKYSFDVSSNFKNVVFNSSMLHKLSSSNFNVYYI